MKAQASVCVCLCMCGSQRSALGVAPQVPSTGWEPSKWARMASQRAPEVPMPVSQLWDYRCVSLQQLFLFFYFFSNMASGHQTPVLKRACQAFSWWSHIPWPVNILMGSLLSFAMGQFICSVFLELVSVICVILGICLPQAVLFIGDSCLWFLSQLFLFL